jgi:hypothetical protein
MALWKRISGSEFQPYDDADFFKNLAIGFAENRPTSGGENNPGHPHQIGKHALFDFTEPLLTRTR